MIDKTILFFLFTFISNEYQSQALFVLTTQINKNRNKNSNTIIKSKFNLQLPQKNQQHENISCEMFSLFFLLSNTRKTTLNVVHFYYFWLCSTCEIVQINLSFFKIFKRKKMIFSIVNCIPTGWKIISRAGHFLVRICFSVFFLCSFRNLCFIFQKRFRKVSLV